MKDYNKIYMEAIGHIRRGQHITTDEDVKELLGKAESGLHDALNNNFVKVMSYNTDENYVEILYKRMEFVIPAGAIEPFPKDWKDGMLIPWRFIRMDLTNTSISFQGYHQPTLHQPDLEL